MKAYVYDHCWEGAEIYFSESREKAVKYFQEIEISLAKERIDQHDVNKSGPIPDYFISRYEYACSDKFDSQIEEYDIEEGSSFWTYGDT